MDETARQQTTKGIWMSRAQERDDGKDGMGKNILVMDVEGTDGRERGEDQDFERKSALFALATSEVLVSLQFREWYGEANGEDCKHLGAPSGVVPGREHGAVKDGV